MRCLASLLLALIPASAAHFAYHVAGTQPGSWPTVLGSIGLLPGSLTESEVVVIPAGAAILSPSEWAQRVQKGSILILEGDSALAASFGFTAGVPMTAVRSIEDLRAPQLRIVWEKPVDVTRSEIPGDARVFARERWAHAPVLAGIRRGAGAVLWLAVPPGEHGYDRFPYLPQALKELGLEPAFRSSRLWAFFDSSYRSRVDLDYLAPLWRKAGISALHVAAWHYWEADPQGDDYLRRLIEACHKNAIQVYAWVELPHVSERFWEQHPEWREKTALQQDAQLDWRKLINLTNREAFAAVSKGLDDLTGRFDWDGVNLAELYFESLEGHDNPARFTPMNQDVRREFAALAGFDPARLFDKNSENAPGLAKFLEFRAELARRQQTEWIGEIEKIRKRKPHLDLVLTHVDDRFDTSMREKIGADTTKTLPLLNQHDFTFLVEDPATIWNLGPQRYPQIAARYRDVTRNTDKLAIDINVVERYQDVYPTKQQTGTELFALVHTAASAFPRVALYFENSILKTDWGLLPSSASTVERVESKAGKLSVRSRGMVGVAWSGPVLVDGKPWPVADATTVWLPPGEHVLEAGSGGPALRVLDFNGDLKAAASDADGIELIYEGGSRAMARLDHKVARVEIDGVEIKSEYAGDVLLLPRGQHMVRLIPLSGAVAASAVR